MLTRDETDPFTAPHIYSWSTGDYSNLSNEWANVEVPSFGIYSGDFADYRMTGTEYADYLINTYNEKLAVLDSLNMSAAATEYLKMNLQMELYQSAVNADMIYNRSYYVANNNWDAPLPAEGWDNEIPTDKMREIAALIEFNNPKIMLPVESILPFVDQKWIDAGIDLGYMNVIYNYRKAYDLAESGEESPNETAFLQTAAPGLADEVIAHQKAKLEEIANLSGDVISETPEVANEKLFEEIIVPHKGKVILVDLWNTRCGPCRRALAHNEPMKSEGGELSSNDIVWVYIADESSPLPLHLKMASGIRGIHYRLTPEQISAIREQFNVDGIPYYILVDREGKFEGRPDMRDHNLFISEIKSKL